MHNVPKWSDTLFRLFKSPISILLAYYDQLFLAPNYRRKTKADSREAAIA